MPRIRCLHFLVEGSRTGSHAGSHAGVVDRHIFWRLWLFRVRSIPSYIEYSGDFISIAIYQ